MNINPDTENVVVDRTAIDGGTGNDVSPTLHGTVMAMMAGAPVNRWGMVGIAPRSIQIVSVGILELGQTTFPFSSYAAGITACLRVREQYDIRVINLSLGDSEAPSSKDYEAMANAIERARNYAVTVVAAAGNDDAGPVEYPAAYPGVLSIAATDTQNGALCSFSNRGDRVRTIAPGCDLDAADPTSGTPDYNYWQGTSEASMIASAALTALDAYRPDLSPEAAEGDLAKNEVLDIARAFSDANLEQIVSQGEAAEPQPETPISPPTATAPQKTLPPSLPMAVIANFQRPSAHLIRIKGRLVLVLNRRPREAHVEVRYLGHHAHSHRIGLLRTFTGDFTHLTMPTFGVVKVSVRYTDPYDLERSSPWTTLKLAANATKGKHHK